MDIILLLHIKGEIIDSWKKKCFPCNKSPTTPSNKFANDELMQVVFYLQGTFILKDSCGTIALMVLMIFFYRSAPMKKTL
jgi:hypothetical protein